MKEKEKNVKSDIEIFFPFAKSFSLCIVTPVGSQIKIGYIVMSMDDENYKRLQIILEK